MPPIDDRRDGGNAGNRFHPRWGSVNTILALLIWPLLAGVAPAVAGPRSSDPSPPAAHPAETAPPPALDFRQIDKVCARVGRHAREYPPTFADERQRCAIENELHGVLDVLDASWEKNRRGLQKNPEFLLRVGHLHSLGHNLDFPGSPEKADLAFRKLLEVAPGHPQGNYLYGMFLFSVPEYQAEGLAYLEKALRLGVEEARYTIGLNHLMSGQAETGLRYLEDYARNHPDSRAPMVIKAYRAGTLEWKNAD